jgi:O-antigen/teichoic acid export membrane protein
MAMATIRKQSIYSSLFIYLGFAIGAFNILYLFPRHFTREQFGLTRILVDIALILATLCTAAAVPVGFKFNPFYKHHLQKGRNDLHSIVVFTVLLSCIILWLASPLLEPLIIRKFGYRSPLLTQYVKLIAPITFAYALLTMLEVFAWNSGKVVASNFMKELFFRGIVLLLLIFWITGIITNYNTFINIYAYLYFPPVLLLLVILYKAEPIRLGFSISKLTKRLYPVMLRFGSAYFISALMNIIAKTNDTLIIASQSTGGLADAAIFTIATYMITVMDVPQRSMIAAATPQIATAWKYKDMQKLDRLYKKTALNLLIFAAGILGIVILSIPLLVDILGQGYAGLPVLMMVLGLGKLIDLGTGLNSQILQLSKHWKIDLFTNMFFVAISIIFNYLLTRQFGILGTAVGSVIAIILFNSVRFIFIKRIYGLQPFSWRNALVVAAATLLVGLLVLMPVTTNKWLEATVKIVFFAGIYTTVIIKMNVSADLTDLFQQVRRKLTFKS